LSFFQNLKQVLQEELFGQEERADKPRSASTSASDLSPTAQSQHDKSELARVEALFKTAASAAKSIERLQEHHRMLEQQIQMVQRHLDLPPEKQQEIFSLLWRTLQEVKDELIALQQAHTCLEQNLHTQGQQLGMRANEPYRAKVSQSPNVEVQNKLLHDLAKKDEKLQILSQERYDLETQLAQREANAHHKRANSREPALIVIDNLVKDLTEKDKKFQTLRQDHYELEMKLAQREVDFRQVQRKYDTLSSEFERAFIKS